MLLDQTVGLARAEINTAVRSTLLYVAIAAGAVVVVIGGLLVLLSALVLIAIALGLPPWAAASLVGILLVGAGAGTAYACVTKLRQVEFDLRHTRRSVKETLGWLKTQATTVTAPRKATVESVEEEIARTRERLSVTLTQLNGDVRALLNPNTPVTIAPAGTATQRTRSPPDYERPARSARSRAREKPDPWESWPP